MKMRIKDFSFNKYKPFTKGLFFIAMVILFTLSVLKIQKSETKPILDKLEEQNKVTMKKLDSIKIDNKILKLEIDSLQDKDSTHKSIINNLYKQHNINYQLLKNLKNEKDYIHNATYDEQLDYISKYRYIPFE